MSAVLIWMALTGGLLALMVMLVMSVIAAIDGRWWRR